MKYAFFDECTMKDFYEELKIPYGFEVTVKGYWQFLACNNFIYSIVTKGKSCS